MILVLFIRSMGNAINILDVKLLEIVGTPAKLIDHNFMKGIFQVFFIDTVGYQILKST